MAAAMIESRSGAGDITRIYMKGDKARIEMPRREGYMVMDVGNRSLKAVIHIQRMVMDMSDLFKDSGANHQQSSRSM